MWFWAGEDKNTSVTNACGFLKRVCGTYVFLNVEGLFFLELELVGACLNKQKD